MNPEFETRRVQGGDPLAEVLPALKAGKNLECPNCHNILFEPVVIMREGKGMMIARPDFVMPVQVFRCANCYQLTDIGLPPQLSFVLPSDDEVEIVEEDE